MKENRLTKDEVLFCELYVNGNAPYAGNASRCYQEVFSSDPMQSGHLAKQLMTRPEIQEYLDKLDKMVFEEARAMKKFLATNLMHIIEETSSAEYCDRRGTALSPAPLRSVAVSASKALMDLYPVKEAQVNKLNISGDNGSGITFNVIVPSKPEKTGTENEQAD